jgi:hypothetical protein
VAATAAAVLEHATLFRVSFVADLVNVTCILGAGDSINQKNPPSPKRGGFLEQGVATT